MNQILGVIICLIGLLATLFIYYKFQYRYSNKETFSLDRDKIAFMFLTVGDVNKHKIWEKFFNQDMEGRYTIYVHPKFPEKVESFFKRYIIGDLVWTEWGDVSLVEATNNMISYALRDKNNKKLVLVSDSCIPIKSFQILYNTIINDNLSWFNYYKPRKNQYGHDVHYNRLRELPRTIRYKAYIHEQWMILDRKHADILDNNRNLLQHFRGKRVIPDEMYYLTSLNLLYNNIHKELRFSENNRDAYLKHDYITSANWFDNNHYSNFHPKTYHRLVRKDLIYLLRSNALFARKFSPESDIDFYWDYIVK